MLTTDDTQEMWNSSLSNRSGYWSFLHWFRVYGRESEMKRRNEEATRQLDGLFFKGE